MASKTRHRSNESTIENRRARRDYFIEDTLECGIRLTGTEIKSVRIGQVSLAEGYVRATETPPRLTLHGAHIAEYPPAGEHRQHQPVRVRALLAHRREIRKLAARTRAINSGDACRPGGWARRRSSLRASAKIFCAGAEDSANPSSAARSSAGHASGSGPKRSMTSSNRPMATEFGELALSTTRLLPPVREADRQAAI